MRLRHTVNSLLCAADGLRIMPDTRTSWPELVGSTPEHAKAVILAESPELLVQVLPAGSFATMDYSETRVRLWLDGNGKVKDAPTIG